MLSVESLGGKLVSIDDLVRRCDFIILTLVLNSETKFIINRDRLALMKPNVVIINVGRGGKFIFISNFHEDIVMLTLFFSTNY